MTSKEKLTKAYHKFMIYFPVIVIFSIILLIYTTYVFTYITILLGTNITPQTDNESKTEPNHYAFSNTSTASTAYNKGVILICIETFFLAMLLLSIFRTILVNPGFIPSPLDLEYKLIAKKHINTHDSHRINILAIESEVDNTNHNLNNFLFTDINNPKQSAYLQL